MHLSDLEPFRSWAVLACIFGFVMAPAIAVELTPSPYDFYAGKPHMPGVYKTKFRRSDVEDFFNYWDGCKWLTSDPTLLGALRHKTYSRCQRYLFKPI